MKTWIALLRGVNVGGKNRLPMADLRKLLSDNGFDDVQTYIQSGNIVFRASGSSDVISGKIRKIVNGNFGFSPDVLVIGRNDLEKAVHRNPFVEAEETPALLHLYFLASKPTRPDTAGIERLAGHCERHAILGKVFYLHAPKGVGRSKLAARAEQLLGVPATARNWRTVEKLLELSAS